MRVKRQVGTYNVLFAKFNRNFKERKLKLLNAKITSGSESNEDFLGKFTNIISIPILLSTLILMPALGC